jgi:hypothetical protein
MIVRAASCHWSARAARYAMIVGVRWPMHSHAGRSLNGRWTRVCGAFGPVASWALVEPAAPPGYQA